MTRELMDDAQAVAEVCALGSQIEKGLMEAEKAARTETPEETEAELRAWKGAPNGGHDPEWVAKWASSLPGVPPVRSASSPVCARSVLPSERGDGLPEK